MSCVLARAAIRRRSAGRDTRKEGAGLMRRIRMIANMSGGRANGTVWNDFPLGTELDVEDWEADELVHGAQVAVLVRDQLRSAEPQQLSGAPPQPPPDIAALAQAAHDEADQAAAHAEVASREAAAAAEAAEPGVPDAGPGQAGVAAGGTPEEPAGTAAEPDVAAAGQPAVAPGPSAPKQAWIDYAVTEHGADVHEASGMTKADLMSRYGGRL